MAKTRPKNLDLSTIKLPVMGLSSILHRVSAVIVWTAMILLLPILYISLASAEGFNQVTSILSEYFLAQFVLWGFLTVLGYFIIGGLKHIIQEFGYFESLQGGALISKIALSLGACLGFVSGFWIWG